MKKPRDNVAGDVGSAPAIPVQMELGRRGGLIRYIFSKMSLNPVVRCSGRGATPSPSYTLSKTFSKRFFQRSLPALKPKEAKPGRGGWEIHGS